MLANRCGNLKQNVIMNSNRIKEIQEQTAYPESKSVHQGLLQVWNECQQEFNKDIREMLIFYELKMRCCSDEQAEIMVDSYLEVKNFPK
jgi:hypothetical protein